jgi:hypothetical protein
MATPDGLSGVFRGVEGSGEAQIIGSGPGLQIAEQILAKDRYEKEKKKKETADVAKLGSGSVTSKWSQTNFKELMPTLSQYRSEFGDVMRGIQTEKDPYKREILKQEYADKFNRLEELAKTDSMVYDEYQKYVDAYKKDPNKFDTEVEVNGRIYNVDEAQAVLANPYNVPELQEEIQKAGGVIPWRAQNWRKFVPETAYSINEDIKSQGIKLDQWIEDDLRKVGGEKLIVIKTGLKPERLESTYNSFWDRKSLKGERFRDQMDRNVSEGAQIVEDSAGNKILIGSDPLMQKSIDFLMSNKKKTETIEDVKARLPKEYGKRVFDKYHQGEEKQSRIPNYWQQINLKSTPGGGSGGDDKKITIPDYYNMTVAPVIENVRNSSLSADEQFKEIADALNLGDKSGSIKILKAANGLSALEMPSPPVKLNEKGLPQPFQFNGQNVLIKKGGNYWPASSNETFVGSIKGSPVMMFKDRNGVTTIPSDPTGIPYLQAVFIDNDGQEFKAQFDLTNPDDRNMANNTLYYGSTGMSQFSTNYKNTNRQAAPTPKKETKRTPPVGGKSK